MFENMTYENILDDMLARVDNDVDKREGSVIYDALAPAAYQLAQVYYNLNNFVDLVSGDTAVGEYLDRVVRDYGITRKLATNAERKITATNPVDIGTRFSKEDLLFTIKSRITDFEYIARCEQAGIIGNAYTGTMQNIDNVDTIATLTDIVTPGADEETDENLRMRFFGHIQTPSASGNSDNYKQWALDVPGVGNAKVFPLWNGNGTVKVLIVDSNMEINETLESVVFDNIEGVRPIGVELTVDSPTSITINATANVKLDNTQTLESVQSSFSAALSSYLKDTVFDIYSISYAKIGSILLSTVGVEDYTDLLVNDSIASITVSETEMPIKGTVTLTEVI